MRFTGVIRRNPPVGSANTIPNRCHATLVRVDTAVHAKRMKETSMAEMMLQLMTYLQECKQRGQGLVEYALVRVLISIVAITVMTTIGSNINTIFQSASNALVAP